MKPAPARTCAPAARARQLGGRARAPWRWSRRRCSGGPQRACVVPQRRPRVGEPAQGLVATRQGQGLVLEEDRLARKERLDHGAHLVEDLGPDLRVGTPERARLLGAERAGSRRCGATRGPAPRPRRQAGARPASARRPCAAPAASPRVVSAAWRPGCGPGPARPSRRCTPPRVVPPHQEPQGGAHDLARETRSGSRRLGPPQSAGAARSARRGGRAWRPWQAPNLGLTQRPPWRRGSQAFDDRAFLADFEQSLPGHGTTSK